MPQDYRQSAKWPGVDGCLSCDYTCSRGISPGTFTLVTVPQYATPDKFGDLVYEDGVNPPFTLYDCQIVNVSVRRTSQGKVYTLRGYDRRWRWRFSSIGGVYNKVDDRGKLIPWTIRSPQELAKLLLDRMAENNPVVQLPDGLKEAAGKNFNKFLMAGENFPMSLTNPAVVWDYIQPARALQMLANELGCDVFYQPVRDRVAVLPLGTGQPPPEKPYEVIADTYSDEPKPENLVVVGAPVPIQARWMLEPVGKDWHGFYVPINDLTYAPFVASNPQSTGVTYVGADSSPPLIPTNLQVTVLLTDKDGNDYIWSGRDLNAAHTPDQMLTKIAADLNGSADFKKFLSLKLLVAPPVSRLEITGLFPGMTFDVQSFVNPGTPPAWGVEQLQAAGNPFLSWSNCPPPSFPTVQPTDRLSYSEAQNLARDTVWKCYRIRNVEIGTSKGPYKLPWYGLVKRRQQIVLLPNKVELVVPIPRIPGGVNRNNNLAGIPPGVANAFGVFAQGFNLFGLLGQVLAGGVLPEFYNGISRAQKATVTGSHFKPQSSTWFFPPAGNDVNDFNTPAGSRVFSDFSIDATEQIVKFASPIYYFDNTGGGTAKVLPPELILETSCYVQDERTNQVQRWEEKMRLGGEGPNEYEIHEDVQVGVIPTYDENNKLVAFKFSDIADNTARAGHYLRGMANKYQQPRGHYRQYIGIVSHDPDGLALQVTWSIGGGGKTEISFSSEHSQVVPPYPVRRRAENLPPDAAAAAANMVERAMIDRIVSAPNTPK